MTAKSCFDFLFSACTVLVLLPLLIGLAIWVKFDSPGPVLFKQVRVGRFGREFRVLKFRTMHHGAERTGMQITVGRDARITRAGTFLRASKLDELPQFFNVLAGDMSIVGPRPEVPKYVAEYPESLRQIVLSVKPGITDLASVTFRNESELLALSDDPEFKYRSEIMPLKLQMYAEYARSRSFWTDLRIIGLTIKAIFVRA